MDRAPSRRIMLQLTMPPRQATPRSLYLTQLRERLGKAAARRLELPDQPDQLVQAGPYLRSLRNMECVYAAR